MRNLLLSFEALLNVAANNPDGFTVDKNTMLPINHGFSVAVKETQNSFNNEGAAKVVSYAAKHNEVNALGGWKNSDNNCYYFDAVMVVENLDEAIKLGRLNEQIAIFNLDTLEEIRL